RAHGGGVGQLHLVPKLHDVEAARYFLPSGLFVVEMIAALVDVTEFDTVAEPDAAGVGLLRTGQHLEQGGFAGTIGTNDANNTAGRQGEGEIVDQQPVAECLGQAFDLDDHTAEAWTGGNLNLRLADLLVAG